MEKNRQNIQIDFPEIGDYVKGDFSDMPGAIKGLMNMKSWALGNLEKIRQKKTTVSFLRDHAILSNSTEQVSDGVFEEFEGLKIEPPPIIEFSIEFPKEAYEEKEKESDDDEENRT